MDGEKAFQLRFALGQVLYQHRIDFDFIDFESLEHSQTEDAILRVAGKQYRALILPAMGKVQVHVRWDAVSHNNDQLVVHALFHPGNLGDPVEKGLLAIGVDRPVDRWGLESR